MGGVAQGGSVDMETVPRGALEVTCLAGRDSAGEGRAGDAPWTSGQSNWEARDRIYRDWKEMGVGWGGGNQTSVGQEEFEMLGRR